MPYRSAAGALLAMCLWSALPGAGCSDSGNGSYDPDAAVTSGGGPVMTCVSDKECRAQGLLCDTGRSICVQCLSSLDCGGSEASTYDCLAGVCVAFTPCTNSRDCNGQVCNKQ